MQSEQISAAPEKNRIFRSRSRSLLGLQGFMAGQVKFFFGYFVLTRLYYITLKEQHAPWRFYRGFVPVQPIQGYYLIYMPTTALKPGSHTGNLPVCKKIALRTYLVCFCWGHYFISGRNHFYHHIILHDFRNGR